MPFHLKERVDDLHSMHLVEAGVIIFKSELFTLCLGLNSYSLMHHANPPNLPYLKEAKQLPDFFPP